ncbi:MAG: hypothetical protein KGH50_03920, partial [Candidatus Micrarchaeota archaeon]|nr:hypothetical protein [Candidatus Micrarchaeota archaeon]
NPNDTVELLVNGTIVATGRGNASISENSLTSGPHSLQGRDVTSGETTPIQTYIKSGTSPTLSFPGMCSNYTYASNKSCTTTVRISTYNNQLTGRLYLNGNLLGTTTSTMSDTRSKPGTYAYVFNTTGNGNYSSNSITYRYTIKNGTLSPASPALPLPVIMGTIGALLSVVVGVVFAFLRRREVAEEQLSSASEPTGPSEPPGAPGSAGPAEPSAQPEPPGPSVASGPAEPPQDSAQAM